ncbi:hypothetical protein F4818DRAFT_446603 [Hypoxylon cercidicola]|nr:hypothetical protein F4818DRAFT_446603 [Hypoxylon cercidicola]
MSNFKQRTFDKVDMRFAAYLSMAITMLFYVLVLCGCLSTSPGVPDLFVLRLQINGSDPNEVRIGYYGMCVRGQGDSSLACLPTYMKDTDALIRIFLAKSERDDQSQKLATLLSVARIIQNKVFYAILAGSAGLFFAGTVAMLLLKRYMKSVQPTAALTRKRYRSGMDFTMQCTFALAVAAAFATTQTSGALNFATADLPSTASGIVVTGGRPLQGLQWSIVVLLFILQQAISQMFPAEGSQMMGQPPMGLPLSMPPPPMGGSMPPPPHF